MKLCNPAVFCLMTVHTNLFTPPTPLSRDILAQQMANIERYGQEFRDTPADSIHRLVDSLRDAIARGDDPRALADVSHEIEFHV